MKGNVYTREKCPLCGQKFQRNDNDLICPDHLTRPRRVYIQLYDKTLHKCINIWGDRKGRFESPSHAFRVLTKIRAEIDEGSYDVTRYVAEKLKPLKFSNWSQVWLEKKKIETQKGLKAPSYFKILQIYVRKYQAFFGEIDIRDISTKKIYEFYLSLSGKPHYIENILSALKKLMQDAFRWEDITNMPRFPKIDVPEPDMNIIDLDIQDKIIQAIPDPMDRAYILFTAREMVRPSETRALQWQDIDLKHDRVIIRRHFSINELRYATKAKQIKHLPLDGEVKRGLLSLPRHLTSPFIFWKGKNGRPFSESWARKIFKRIARAQGINISLYNGTRHSSATEAADRVGIDATQEFLHHTNRRMTERYVKQNPDRLRKVLRIP